LGSNDGSFTMSYLLIYFVNRLCHLSKLPGRYLMGKAG
jgi:hypothetical protein